MRNLLQPCTFPEYDADGSMMLCRMPVASLPDDLMEQLEQSETQTINGTDGPGVAVYWASDGTARADFYLGLTLDGFTRYENITTVETQLPSARGDVSRGLELDGFRRKRSDDPDDRLYLQFLIPPDLLCTPGDPVDFDPSKHKIISIKVNKRAQHTQQLYIISKSKAELWP